MGNNGTVLESVAARVNSEVARPNAGTRIALGLLPTTPVQFSGKDAFLAWGRLVGYSALAYFTFNKMRPASYVFMGAAGLSLATSLSAGLWKKESV